ncbi:MAG: nickel-responsive transcriptional regulator NikR [Candidatus Methylarchaceae archaeon HK02M1]|nr:nickel-responsive transcriptional regulator NikR [Candidatus Methylarchaceae archaeon HK02M1]
MTKRGVSRISISIPPDLLEEFDRAIKNLGYDRSKGIQVAMRDFLTENKYMYEERGMVAGAITIIYNHKVKGLEDDLTDTQHLHYNVISSTMHIHLDERNCLEIIAVKGEAKSIHNLAKKLMVRGVKQIKLAIVS